MVRRGTYSIVARDPDTLELGVAVQSHWFSVGSIVPSARAGVGVVAVQSVPDTEAGAAILGRLADREDAREALRQAVSGPGAAMRQIGVVDALGRSAVWTGGGCIAHASDVEGPGYATLANMMLREGVAEAMAAAYEAADGPLAERLLAALDAGEAAGGDLRGRQSAALVVVPAEGPAHARAVDVRVDDHADPLAELRRLLVLHRAYELAGTADELAVEGRHAEATELYERAAELAPDQPELLFWAGLGAGVEDGVPLVRRAIERNPRLAILLERLTADVSPSAPAIHRALSGGSGA